MERNKFLALYKVKWTHTANTYVVCDACRCKSDIIDMVQKTENRMDDIVDVERIKLPALDGNDVAKVEYVNAFITTPQIW